MEPGEGLSDEIQIRSARPDGVSEDEWKAQLDRMRETAAQNMQGGDCADDKSAAEQVLDWLTPDLPTALRGLCILGGMAANGAADCYSAGGYSAASGQRLTLFLTVRRVTAASSLRSSDAQSKFTLDVEIEVAFGDPPAVTTTTTTSAPQAPSGTSIEVCVSADSTTGHTSAEWAFTATTTAPEPAEWTISLTFGANTFIRVTPPPLSMWCETADGCESVSPGGGEGRWLRWLRCMA